MKKLLSFLFGKSPDIFDEKGRVYHQHPKKKWEQWDARYRSSSEYNWRDHQGQRLEGVRDGKKSK